MNSTEVLSKDSVSKTQKPVLAIMGEFSAGKSTLSNLLLGSDPLPVKVTATQLPPVWISHGNSLPYREDLKGDIHPVDLEDLNQIPLEETALIRLFLEADILEMCDFIDMPGISDPNMSSDVWERVIHNADAVLWCTHATQAWRQSEAAVWKSMSPDLYSKSLLLITRIDKLLTEKDQRRVVKRARKETMDMFAGIFPISLTQALEAREDRQQWEHSGAEAFSKSLVDLLHELSETSEDLDPSDVRKPIKFDNSPEYQKVVRLEAAIREEKNNPPATVTPARVSVAASAGRQTVRPEPRNRQEPLTTLQQIGPDDQRHGSLRQSG